MGPRLVQNMGYCSIFRQNPIPGRSVYSQQPPRLPWQTTPRWILYQCPHCRVYPSKLASAIIEIFIPRVSQSSSFNQDFTQWKQLLAKRPIARGPRITDGAGNNSSASWTILLCQDTFKGCQKTMDQPDSQQPVPLTLCTRLSY